MPIPQNEFPFVPLWDYETARAQLQSGDLLFCSGERPLSKLVKKFTSSLWSHVGIIMHLEEWGRVMLMESVESVGVRTIPLSNYIWNYQHTQKGYPGRILVARHQEMTPELAKKLAQSGLDLLGRPYDKDEVLRVALRITGIDASSEVTQNDAFISSEYVYECFLKAGISFTYNPKGIIAPADIANDMMVSPIAEINIAGGQ